MPEISALLLGDLVGTPGCRALFFKLPELLRRLAPDLVVVNGENAHHGFGLHPDQMKEIFQSGVDVITTGNHVWEEPSLLPFLDSEPRLLRPANYSPDLPGRGHVILEKKGYKIAVMNFQGRLQMALTHDPFSLAKTLVAQVRTETPLILVDFHGESPEEKEAFGFYLDGQVSLVAGTHTHIQTADLKILPGGTAYITDLGMCGPVPSVIGGNIVESVRRNKTQLPIKIPLAEAPGELRGIFIVMDSETGKTLSTQVVHEPA
ncbi:MAG: metallophosphoesterase [Spirochaetes bacterium GWB1_48_6]|nr:MAG: metallophosphoesterase [Spirochaetes bacterium GWB1_48_6]